jgi:hypothetical protein
MEADRTERHNIIQDNPERADKMIADWDAWANRADVDPWTGAKRNDWGEEIRPAGQKKAAAKKNAKKET